MERIEIQRNIRLMTLIAEELTRAKEDCRSSVMKAHLIEIENLAACACFHMENQLYEDSKTGDEYQNAMTAAMNLTREEVLNPELP